MNMMPFLPEIPQLFLKIVLFSSQELSLYSNVLTSMLRAYRKPVSPLFIFQKSEYYFVTIIIRFKK